MACRECHSLYLRERPDRASIGQYYRTYYTHSDGSRSANISGINVGSAVLRRLANSWRNFRYGTQRESFGMLGTFLMVVLQPLRRWIDAESRHHHPPRRVDLGFEYSISAVATRAWLVSRANADARRSAWRSIR